LTPPIVRSYDPRMHVRSFLPFLTVAAALSGVACSSSSTSSTTGGDAGSHHDAASVVTPDGGSKKEAGTGAEAGSAPTPTTTIAAARSSNSTAAIVVKGFVTALAGVPKDYPQWYIEDPAGGPNSGVLVYCDPLLTKACTVTEPALNDLIVVSGSLETYKGQVEMVPTAMTVLQANATPPPVAAVTTADIAPTANSPYRGVFVQVTIPSKLTVDSVNPAALADTACGAVIPADGGAPDAAPPACTNKCEPPLYSGFRANDGAGNEIYVQAPFFYTDPLQSSPECLTGSGVVPVTVGMTFSKMSGVLDVDPYSMMQAVSPVIPADYATP